MLELTFSPKAKCSDLKTTTGMCVCVSVVVHLFMVLITHLLAERGSADLAPCLDANTRQTGKP